LLCCCSLYTVYTVHIRIGDGHTVCPYCKSSLLENAGDDNKRGTTATAAATDATTSGAVTSNNASNNYTINIGTDATAAVVPLDIESGGAIGNHHNGTVAISTTNDSSNTLSARINRFLTRSSSTTQDQPTDTTDHSRSNSVRGAAAVTPITVTPATAAAANNNDAVHAQHMLDQFC
jgi:hypothetical protein